MNYGAIGYLTGGIFFLIFALLLLTGQQARSRKRLLMLSAGLSAIWAGASAVSATFGYSYLVPHALEVIRDIAWILFLLRILMAGFSDVSKVGKEFLGLVNIGAALGLVLVALISYRYIANKSLIFFGSIDVLFAAQLMLALVGLILVEQIIRNTRSEARRAIKYLCFGLGGMFAYDFYMYSNALMFQRVDPVLWQSRGFVNALVVPVIGLAVARNPKWSMDVFVSRRIVFHTAAILGAAVYMLAMGAGGYYVRIYGGSWGAVAQVAFLFGALLLLFILLFSGQLRANLRVLINKHFFHYKYDYRDEWLQFSRTLSTAEPQKDLRERAIRGLAGLMDCAGGILWLRRESGDYNVAARWQMDDDVPECIAGDSSLVRFLEEQEWVINLDEYESDRSLHVNLELPAWLSQMSRGWLVTPLVLNERLFGFVVLGRSLASNHFNWEDCDLLKTAGRQAASYLAQFESSELLAEARQFEACNRLSAYVMHDLKNLIAQLSLVVSNASRHKHNPQFMEDAIATVENSVNKMNRLLQHLRSGGGGDKPSVYVDLCPLLGEVVKTMSAGAPVPSLDCQAKDIGVRTNPDRFAAVVGHLIRNAQDATPDDGRIIVRLFKSDDHAIIEVQDSGNGMDEEFIRERLFRPFDTTKGTAGMGIGAYETREFVHAMGGELSVISRVGEGSTFRVRLAISDKPVNEVKLEIIDDPRYTDGSRVKEIAGR